MKIQLKYEIITSYIQIENMRSNLCDNYKIANTYPRYRRVDITVLEIGQLWLLQVSQLSSHTDSIRISLPGLRVSEQNPVKELLPE